MLSLSVTDFLCDTQSAFTIMSFICSLQVRFNEWHATRASGNHTLAPRGASVNHRGSAGRFQK